MAGTTVVVRGEHRADSEGHQQTVQINALVNDVERLADAMRRMMPGVLLSDAANKTGTTSAAKWRTEAFTFTFRGKITSAAAAETAFTATTHDVAASKQAIFCLSVQTDGTTFTITKAADQTIGTDVYPTGPDNEILVGYLTLVTGAGGIFDASTDDVTAGAGNLVTVTFADVKGVGAAALTAATISPALGGST